MSIVRGQNIVNDPLSLNLYSYCQNNPIRYRDSSGNMAAEITIAATNLWNPVGWVAASVLAVEIGIVAGVAIYAGIQYVNDKAVNNAHLLMAYASTTAPPLPPNDPNSKGTQTTSKTL